VPALFKKEFLRVMALLLVLTRLPQTLIMMLPIAGIKVQLQHVHFFYWDLILLIALLIIMMHMES
jgi:hypothetical protein